MTRVCGPGGSAGNPDTPVRNIWFGRGKDRYAVPVSDRPLEETVRQDLESDSDSQEESA
jgi:hypothetical protein